MGELLEGARDLRLNRADPPALILGRRGAKRQCGENHPRNVITRELAGRIDPRVKLP